MILKKTVNGVRCFAEYDIKRRWFRRGGTATVHHLSLIGESDDPPVLLFDGRTLDFVPKSSLPTDGEWEDATTNWDGLNSRIRRLYEAIGAKFQ